MTTILKRSELQTMMEKANLNNETLTNIEVPKKRFAFLEKLDIK
jgi:hypothetical protein